MPRSKLYVPDEVILDIRKRVSEGIKNISHVWESASEEEDSFTGHFGGSINEYSRKVLVPQGEFPGVWTWSLRYRKLRGRGPKAPEKALGADGIVELVVDGQGYYRIKSFLFQSKFWDRKDPRLIEQCALLSNWREAAAIFVYEPDDVRVISIDALLAARGDTKSAISETFSDFMSDRFLKCLIGDVDLRYDIDTRTLVWRNIDDKIVSVRFSLKHRLRARIIPPERDPLAIDQGHEIEQSDILKHRMYVEPQEILTPQHKENISSFKEAKNLLMKTYHPDQFLNFSEPAREAVNARAKEINGAWDYLKKHPR